MRNKLFIITIVIFSFLLIDKVSALEVTYDYDSDKLNLLDDNKEIVDNIVNIANDNNTNNYTFVIFFGRDSNGYHLSVGIAGYTCDNLYFGPYKNPYGYYLQSTVVQPGLNISLIKNFNQYYKFYFTDDLENFYNSISNVFLNGTTTNNGLLSQYASSNPFYSDYLSNSIFAIPVYSNVPIEYYQFNTSYNDTIKINEVVYSYGDTIPTYYDYAYSSPTIYKFDDTIHDDNIAQTYFNLNLQDLAKNDYNLNLKYAYGNYTSDILAPFLKITYNDNTNSYISIVTDEKPTVNVFMGYFEMCLDNSKPISNVQIVFPMENTKDIDYKIQLESNVKFDISYVYDEIFNNYLQTIDITGKYSVNFIPKLVEHNSDVFQDFYLIGDNFEIRILHNVDSDIQNAINTVYKNWNRSSFRYFEGVNQVTNAIQFINNDYENYPLKTYSVTYDTRYWAYSIFEKRDSVILVTNPNTGITNTWDATKITQNIYTKLEYSDFQFLYSTLKKFIDEHDSSVNLVTLSLFNIFDTCPYYIKNLFFVFILFSIIACFVSFLGWK
ncbi:MAG: hypothetical protein HFI87_02095 [Bacilli bacterium]|nr:hypothetical protein [Bacilli bacterium]